MAISLGIYHIFRQTYIEGLEMMDVWWWMTMHDESWGNCMKLSWMLDHFFGESSAISQLRQMLTVREPGVWPRKNLRKFSLVL